MSIEQERFALALHNCARSWRNALDRRLKSLDLSQAAWMTIAMVTRNREPLSQIDLANKLGVEGATMVSMLDRLVKAELIERQPCESDRRVKHIALTAKGKEIHGELRKRADSFRTQILQELDQKQLSDIANTLESLTLRIENTREE